MFLNTLLTSIPKIVDFIKYFLSANTDTIYSVMFPVEQAQLLFLNTNVKWVV